MARTRSGSAMRPTVVRGQRIGKYPEREFLTLTQALVLELGLKSEAMANKRLYDYPTIKDLACAEVRARLTAGDEPGLQRFLHDIQAAARRMPAKADTVQLLELTQMDADDNAPLTAFAVYHNRETFLAWRQKAYRFIGMALGVIESGNGEFQL